jgi:hypothetical protein
MTNIDAISRYAIRLEGSGWAVVNIETGEPALVGGVRQRDLLFEDADDLAKHLNIQGRS